MSSAENSFDVVVIGAGPGGYVAALRAAQLGLKTACVEKDATLGGTCLNVGCIPSKALLDSSEHFYYAKNKFSKHGVVVDGVKLDLPQMLKRKDQVVSGLTQGIAGLFKKNKITWLKGLGKLTGPKTVLVTAADGTTQTVEAKNIILATGSVPASLPTAPFDGKRIIHSTHALNLPEVPGSMLVIGAGAIGLEMGSVWSRLGTKVTVVEFQDRIVPVGDKQTTAELLKILKKQGLEFKLSTKVLKATNTGKGVVVDMQSAVDAAAPVETGTYDYVLVAIGRKPFSEGVGLEALGLTTDKLGRVEVDKHYRTKVPNIYAIGDLIQGPMLAHKAEDEGVACAEIIAGKPGHVNYECIPNVVYTWPELASVGRTEEECKQQNLAVKTGVFPFLANGRAKAMEEVDGFVKVIADAKTDRVLGVHIVGPRASDMISTLRQL